MQATPTSVTRESRNLQREPQSVARRKRHESTSMAPGLRTDKTAEYRRTLNESPGVRSLVQLQARLNGHSDMRRQLDQETLSPDQVSIESVPTATLDVSDLAVLQGSLTKVHEPESRPIQTALAEGRATLGTNTVNLRSSGMAPGAGAQGISDALQTMDAKRARVQVSEDGYTVEAQLNPRVRIANGRVTWKSLVDPAGAAGDWRHVRQNTFDALALDSLWPPDIAIQERPGAFFIPLPGGSEAVLSYTADGAITLDTGTVLHGAELDMVQVPAAFRRLGLGQRLLDRFIASFPEPLILECDEGGPVSAAQLEAWYADNGFVTQGRSTTGLITMMRGEQPDPIEEIVGNEKDAEKADILRMILEFDKEQKDKKHQGGGGSSSDDDFLGGGGWGTVY